MICVPILCERAGTESALCKGPHGRFYNWCMMARMLHSYITTVRYHDSDSMTGACVDQTKICVFRHKSRCSGVIMVACALNDQGPMCMCVAKPALSCPFMATISITSSM